MKLLWLTLWHGTPHGIGTPCGTAPGIQDDCNRQLVSASSGVSAFCHAPEAEGRLPSDSATLAFGGWGPLLGWEEIARGQIATLDCAMRCYYTVLRYTQNVAYYTVPFVIVLMLSSTILYSTVWYWTVRCIAVPRDTIQHHAIPYQTIPYHMIPYSRVG